VLLVVVLAVGYYSSAVEERLRESTYLSRENYVIAEKLELL
jgi:hypothetical protein